MKLDYLLETKVNSVFENRFYRVMLVLSIFVILCVFWSLKLTGITMAGEAFCGMDEHVHGETCAYSEDVEALEDGSKICILEEHIHDSSCYSDSDADIETASDWKKLTEGLTLSDNAAENLVAIARSQVGYEESTLNFEVDEYDVRRGITRYGQWYGNPYGDWSAMFASFCLEYSGATDLPISAGAESMRLAWEKLEFYRNAIDYAPSLGDVAFLDKDGNGEADSVAIVIEIIGEEIKVVEGDFENVVAEVKYPAKGSGIMGYGHLPVKQLIKDIEGQKLIAYAEEYSKELFKNGNNLIVYLSDESGDYALDGNGEYVDIVIKEDGSVYTSSIETELLFWSVEGSNEEEPKLQNVQTKMYLPETNTAVSTYDLRASNTGSDNQYQYARAVNYTVWLDGTIGDLMSYDKALNQKYTVTGGGIFVLPNTLQSTPKYNYKIRGWYDVINNKYYLPGEEVIVNSNMVFYADWVANSYDIGQFNSDVANTISTNEFVTTRMFDYNVLFNVLSSSATVEVNSNSHSETWKLITNGKAPYNGEETLNYIFRDWDRGSRDITYPSGVNNPGPHYPTDVGDVYPGLYNNRIGDLLFNPDTEVIGKEYLGIADHLFQLCLDPSDEHYGYYYYDSERNAASYNQTDQRFYVYDYLEQTTVSNTTDGPGKYSDFLPLNSPYVNTNGKTPATYEYEGKYGGYDGVKHYMYDGTDSNSNYVATNFLFGMSVDIDFYLPNDVGTGGNHDLYGNDMTFEFSGDDDVWVFVDGKLVLDLGGIHSMESGTVDFSTGEVTINGTRNTELSNTLKTIKSGEHVLTLYYLERGSSMSNCAIYFNLAPRFSFSIEKEDVLTKETLNGAQFSVYTDKACTKPAELWTSKAAHDNGEKTTNIFTVVDGVAEMWGMGAGNTYYIKETKPPDSTEYTHVSGIISITFDKTGTAAYDVEVIKDGNNNVSGGFTVHGIRVDDETQKAFIVATNAPKWVNEVTDVWARKVWNDDKSHSNDVVTVYLTVKDEDGTVRRLQEATLGEDNNWMHQWTNLPKYYEDGKTLIKYGVEESYVNGYYSKVTETDSFDISSMTWTQASTFESGKTYLLSTGNGCLSSYDMQNDTGFKWIPESEAKFTPAAQWKVSASGSTIKLTNGLGQILTFYYNGGSSGYPTDFFAYTGGESSSSKQSMKYVSTSGGIKLYYDGEDNRDYYLINTMTSSHKFQYSTEQRNGLIFYPIVKKETSQAVEVTGYAFEITNTPLKEETSVTVHKKWDYGYITPDGS
ncbi:MAG: fibro-slime domain-containing protein, partial [Firmicutes bacterium]|nr:fibro-slime domain-containing protein [Bacillota bacterium]